MDQLIPSHPSKLHQDMSSETCQQEPNMSTTMPCFPDCMSIHNLQIILDRKTGILKQETGTAYHLSTR